MAITIDTPDDLEAAALCLHSPPLSATELGFIDSRSLVIGARWGFLAGYLAGERDHAAGVHDPKAAYARISA